MLLHSRITGGIIEKNLEFLQDGDYLIKLVPLNKDRTVTNYRENYFLLVDLIAAFSGEERYAIHKRHKSENEVATTTTFTEPQWAAFIESLKYSALQKYDLCL